MSEISDMVKAIRFLSKLGEELNNVTHPLLGKPEPLENIYLVIKIHKGKILDMKLFCGKVSRAQTKVYLLQYHKMKYQVYLSKIMDGVGECSRPKDVTEELKREVGI